MDIIINELAAIPTLRDIDLNYLKHSSHIGNLDAFSNLHKIRIQVATFCPHNVTDELAKLVAQCPSLTDLDIRIEGGSNMPQLFKVLDSTGKPLSLRHLGIDRMGVPPGCFSVIGKLRSLQSLHIHRFSSNNVVSEVTIWDILLKEKIYIQDLSTDVADDSLLRYISSFHGMRKFSIAGFPSPLFDPIAILQIMITHHAESLTELCMLDPILSEKVINLLSSIKNIRYFGVQLQFSCNYPSTVVSVSSGQYVLFTALTGSGPRNLLFGLVQKYFRNCNGSFSMRRGYMEVGRNMRFHYQTRESMKPLLNTNSITSLLLPLRLNVKVEFTFHTKTRRRGPSLTPTTPRILLPR